MIEQVIQILNDLIQISKDGELGFKKLAAYMADEHIKEMLYKKAEGCRIAAEELQEHVKNSDTEVTNDESILRSLERDWMSIEDISTNFIDTILIECERKGAAAKIVYEKALQNVLPHDIKNMVQDQYKGLIDNYNFIKQIKTRKDTKEQL